MSRNLTARGIENLKPKKKRYEVADGVLPRFYCVVQSTGKKSWIVRYWFDGKKRKYTIGSYPAYELGEARKVGRQVLQQVAEGIDPAAEKKRLERAANDDGDLIENFGPAYLKHRAGRKGWKPSYVKEADRLFAKEILPCWAGMSIKDIAHADIVQLLLAITGRDGVRGVTANGVYATIISPMFRWAQDIGKIESSPVPSKEALLSVGAIVEKRSRSRVLSENELTLLWQTCNMETGHFGHFYKLALLLGQRRGEVAGMTWGEVDLEKQIWTIPGKRTKNGRDQIVHLSNLVVSILNDVIRFPNPNNYVFYTGGKKHMSGYSRAKRRITDKMVAASKAKIPQWGFHDLRRSLVTGMNEQLRIHPHIVEACVNHVSGASKSGVAGMYNRASYLTERKNAFNAWSDYIERLIGAKTDNVVRLEV